MPVVILSICCLVIQLISRRNRTCMLAWYQFLVVSASLSLPPWTTIFCGKVTFSTVRFGIHGMARYYEMVCVTLFFYYWSVAGNWFWDDTCIWVMFGFQFSVGILLFDMPNVKCNQEFSMQFIMGYWWVLCVQSWNSLIVLSLMQINYWWFCGIF